METKFRFTKKALEDLPIPTKRVRVRDEGVPGLVLELTPKGVRTFRVYKKIKGHASPINVTLGKFPDLSIEQARRQATEAIHRLGDQVNPNEEARAARKSKVTLEEVFKDYCAARPLTPSSLRGYTTVINNYLDAYKTKPLANITEEVVKKEHHRLSQASQAQADLTMRVLRALFNFAKYEYRGLNNRFLFDHNPVGILSHQRSWNKIPRKHTRITRSQLPVWFQGVCTLRDTGEDFTVAVCDLVEMALLTGLRKSELLGLTWNQVNMADRSYHLTTTKNGDPLELPITDRVFSILERRQRLYNTHGFVFNADNLHGVIREPKKVINQIREATGVEFTLHDLRRTFTTTAESLGVGTYTIKRLLNHRTRRDDVTAGYVVLTPEELRPSAQAIEDALLQHAGLTPPAQTLDTRFQALIASLSEDKKQQLMAELTKESL
ncbi:tyrosine-type recombinase/integrase [Saccharospirillum alexandrii]|uniref:tyrosine-type recombinase/integrase n=1 Tax=Saccharospirillum alexandrii TaxID=2448477 RepID=UPI0013E04C73|nr:tyrosine-type recombinase/integrase [Saccharospirillum alexandrii]